MMEEGVCSKWSREEDRAFEDALVAYFDEDDEECWERIAKGVKGKSVEEVKCHYKVLVDDLERIESGLVPLPCYSTCSDESERHGGGDEGSSKKGGHRNGEAGHGGKLSKVDQERRKGVAWSEDEHRLFLLGLEKYGKGDWRSISRNFVVSRTPTQVASHAQKYFIRLNSMNRERRRSSIHDITSVNDGDTSAPQAAITGDPNTSAGNSGNQVGFFGGTTLGQPVGLPLGSAVGTPVTLPPPAHIAYGIRAPGQFVPGAPMNMGPTSSRR